MKENKGTGGSVIQSEVLTACIPKYTRMVIKQGVIKDTTKDMELENLMQQLNLDNHKYHPIPFQITHVQYRKLCQTPRMEG
jgi:hypothetical protein